MRKHLLMGAFALFSLLSNQVMAQETNFKCGSHEMMKKVWAENPGLREDMEHLMSTYTEKRTINNKSVTVRIIPIVFHIVHEYGAENVTDAQIYDQMDILNEDYRKLNADTSVVVTPFDTIIGDAMIEFRLATIDPYGNCTNGIEHIYNHQTNQGDDYSKMHQWNRRNYLNVWVVKTIGSAGVAGYAYYPTATVGNSFWIDGIIILNDYVGSIGTSAPFSSRALTHEIGHWLGLAHTWGNDNDPGVASSCSQDDGIGDTPNCIGMTSCQMALNSCVDGTSTFDYWYPNDPQDNAQNYMDYSYCSVMFTEGQCNYMNNVLDQETGGRNNLYTAANLALTGTDFDPNVIAPPTCVPVPDFYVDMNGATGNTGSNANNFTACAGDPITFYNASWNAGVTSYSWDMPGATPSTSTAQNPAVTYAQPGWYTVSLTVTNSAGSATKTMTNYIYIQGNWAEYYGPRTDDFNANSDFWLVNNPENNENYFFRSATGGKSNTACMKLNIYRDLSNVEAFSEESYYNDRLGNTKDYMISPAYDLRNTSNVSISFDYAYGTKATATADITEKLVVYSSRDCGKTWTQRLSMTGTQLVSAGFVGNTDFTPNNDNLWKTATFNYTPNSTDNKTRFKIEFIASDNSNNFYFDNWNVSGTLGIEDNGLSAAVNIAPNPVTAGSNLTVEIPTNQLGMELVVVDMNGNVVSTTTASAGTTFVEIPMNVAKGCYLLNATQGGVKATYRVVVM